MVPRTRRATAENIAGVCMRAFDEQWPRFENKAGITELIMGRRWELVDGKHIYPSTFNYINTHAPYT
jgi:hypothetical protein